MSTSSNNQVSDMELPELSPEMENVPQVVGGEASATTEISAAQASEQGQPTTKSQPLTNDSDFDSDLGPQPAVALYYDPSQTPDSALSTALQTPQIADDSDLIEKEWVEKAKMIVEHTKSDPRQQNKELSKVKSDYLKKRYNKDLRLAED